MIRCVVESVRVHEDKHVVNLRDDSGSFMPIWIGPDTASAIGNALTGNKSERPLTHDLLLTAFEKLGVRVARVVRSSALSIVNMPYIEATRAVGSGAVRIMFRHVAPNVFAPYLIMLTAFLGQAILLEASLSFLGLGVFEPTPSWGLMLRGAGMQFLEQAPWLAIAPGVAISMAVFGFNLFGDSLRDALDPRLRTA